jgi:hypothetical protein
MLARIRRRAEGLRPHAERPLMSHGAAGVTRTVLEQPRAGGRPVAHRATPIRHRDPLPPGRPGPLTGSRGRGRAD